MCECGVVSRHVSRRHVNAVKMELLELQCMEEKYSTLLGLVAEPVNRMSTCRLPPAVSDLSDFAFQVCCCQFVIVSSLLFCQHQWCTQDFTLGAYLWSPYVMAQTIIFSSCFFFFLLFFPRLISAVGDWMFTVVRHMVWP